MTEKTLKEIERIIKSNMAFAAHQGHKNPADVMFYDGKRSGLRLALRIIKREREA
jgi:hypothetical protein